MRTNNLLTYVLYALLGLLILIAGYKACEMKKAQALQDKENAEFQQQMRDMGYTEEDTTASKGSSYVAETEKTGSTAATDKSAKKPAANKSGIEGDDEPASKPVTSSTDSKKSAATDTKTTGTTETKPKTSTSTTTKSTLTAKGGASSAGKYMVVTGAFKDISNARDEMEILIKMGYTNAEVRSLKSGWHHVIASRSNSRDAAGKLADKLRDQGFDGAYVK